MTVDKPVYNAPTTKESLKLASESGIEEFELELPGLIKAWEEWRQDNPGGSFRDFLDDVPTPRRIKLEAGGDVEKYEDLIDAFEKGIDVMPGEDLTKYIRRVRLAELQQLLRDK
jgi:hypothetical protein